MDWCGKKTVTPGRDNTNGHGVSSSREKASDDAISQALAQHLTRSRKSIHAEYFRRHKKEFVKRLQERANSMGALDAFCDGFSVEDLQI